MLGVVDLSPAERRGGTDRAVPVRGVRHQVAEPDLRPAERERRRRREERGGHVLEEPPCDPFREVAELRKFHDGDIGHRLRSTAQAEGGERVGVLVARLGEGVRARELQAPVLGNRQRCRADVVVLDQLHHVVVERAERELGWKGDARVPAAAADPRRSLAARAGLCRLVTPPGTASAGATATAAELLHAPPAAELIHSPGRQVGRAGRHGASRLLGRDGLRLVDAPLSGLIGAGRGRLLRDASLFLWIRVAQVLPAEGAPLRIEPRRREGDEPRHAPHRLRRLDRVRQEGQIAPAAARRLEHVLVSRLFARTMRGKEHPERVVLTDREVQARRRGHRRGLAGQALACRLAHTLMLLVIVGEPHVPRHREAARRLIEGSEIQRLVGDGHGQDGGRAQAIPEAAPLIEHRPPARAVHRSQVVGPAMGHRAVGRQALHHVGEDGRPLIRVARVEARRRRQTREEADLLRIKKRLRAVHDRIGNQEAPTHRLLGRELAPDHREAGLGDRAVGR
jgi:hypothetical protein